MSDLYLGIDTSNYRTSAAVTDSAGKVVFERAELLDVGAGKRGLRQSEAFFMHSNRLPGYISDMSSEIDTSCLRAVGVSTRPRRVEGSYMPCFLAGANAAAEIGAVLGIPVYEFSHQEGHAAAVIEDPSYGFSIADSEQSSGGSGDLLFHLSGGTTEFLQCLMDDNGYDLRIAGGTLDISIGQLIDRAGVAMGLPFPAGPYIDELALSVKEGSERDIILPVLKVRDGHFNLSGIETSVLRRPEIEDREKHPELAAAVMRTVTKLLADSAQQLADKTGARRVFMAGGVASSRFVRDNIMKYTDPACRPEIIFGDPAYSGDNAAGTARLAGRIHRNRCGL